MNGCGGSYKATDFHTDLQFPSAFCPAHTRSPSAYILSGRNSREFKEGDFQRGQTQRGAQPSFVGPPLTPCRRHALHRTSGSSGQTSINVLPTIILHSGSVTLHPCSRSPSLTLARSCAPILSCRGIRRALSRIKPDPPPPQPLQAAFRG